MTDERIRAYLLHELTPSETKEFEEQCFAQEEWPPTLESAEADLIDAYIRKELSPDRQRRFEENYLNTAARRERVLLARSFLRLVCAPEPKELNPRKRAGAFWTTGLSIPRVALRPVAIGLVLIVGALLSLWYLIPRAPQTFASVSLKMSESNRGEGEKERRVNNIYVTRIGFPLTADALLLSFQLPEPSPEGAKYSVQWENVKNRLGPLEVVHQEAKSLIVVIPATRLRPGQYNLKVFRSIHGGPEEPVNGDYFFDVESSSEHDANKGNQLP
jgi:hypothetical protein